MKEMNIECTRIGKLAHTGKLGRIGGKGKIAEPDYVVRVLYRELVSEFDNMARQSSHLSGLPPAYDSDIRMDRSRISEIDTVTAAPQPAVTHKHINLKALARFLTWLKPRFSYSFLTPIWKGGVTFMARQSSRPSASPPAYRSQLSARIGKLAGRIGGMGKIAEPDSVGSVGYFNFTNIFLRIPILLIAGMLAISCNDNGPNTENNSSQTAAPEITLELNPSENNPRNSEGDFVTLKDGTVMFVYSKYVGESSSDHAPASLAARYSTDGGVTWTSEDQIIVPNEGGMNVMSVTLLRLQNGDIALFYLRKNSTEDCIPMLRISRDEAKTWSEAIPCITDKEGYFVLNNARVIQLQDGRLMMAVALHNTPGGEWKGQADLFSYYSDDNGRTWTASPKVPNNTDIVTQEPGLIEMKDGRVMMYIRASGGFQQLSYSSDRGMTWSAIETSNIPSPLSPATIEKVPGSEDWLLVWNNNDGSDPDLQGKRTPLTAAISTDEGKSWNYIKNIEEDPDGWYCYISIHFVDEDNVLLGYCAGNRPAGTSLSVTHVTHIPVDWLYQPSN